MKRLIKLNFAYRDKYSQTYSYYKCICGVIKIIRDGLQEHNNLKIELNI